TWESRSSPGLHVCEYELPAGKIITLFKSLKKPHRQRGGGFCVRPRVEGQQTNSLLGRDTRLKLNSPTQRISHAARADGSLAACAHETAMGSSQRFTPLIANTVMAFTGVVVVFALLRPMLLDERSAATPVSQPLQPRIDRLTFVRPGAFTQSIPPSNDPLLKPSLMHQSEVANAWSTETRSEPSPPRSGWRFTLLPSLRRSSEHVKPNTRLRAYTLKARLAEITPTALHRLNARFAAAKAIWPPAEVAFIAIKDERALELHARPHGGTWKRVHTYRVLAASGGGGPKLRQGDRQVPEGVYGIASLNPNSAYHLSLRVNYPNSFDRQMAGLDGRRDLGGDIMIHGKSLSAGCLAVGDEAVEELFVLAALTGLSNVKLIISPTDFREKGTSAQAPGQPPWLPKLYTEIASSLNEFKKPRSAGLLSLFTK
ncbi:MAG: hypothetical protein ABL901_20290, partial [Hyphomicrobiaceae bacterium]